MIMQNVFYSSIGLFAGFMSGMFGIIGGWTVRIPYGREWTTAL